MTQFFRVEGGITKLIEESVVYEAATKDFAALLAAPRDNNIMFLPGQTRGMFAHGESGTVAFLIEQPPAVRTISWPATNKKHTAYTLAFPWVYFIMTATRENPENPKSKLRMQSWAVFCAKNRFSSLDDTFYPLPVNNVYQDGRICFGTAVADEGQNIGEHIDHLILNFWNANFNYDVMGVLPGYREFKDWEAASATDPACWLKWPWADRKKWNTRIFKVEELVKISEDRISPIVLPNPIPALPSNPTFGRAAEWCSTLSDQNKRFLLAALQGIAAPNPIEMVGVVEDPEQEEDTMIDGLMAGLRAEAAPEAQA